jgi:hypothetical protein
MPHQRGRREAKIIALVACPHCGARIGEPCIPLTDADRATMRGRLFAHGDRRRAWQDWRRKTPVGFFVQPGSRGDGRLFPQSEEAREAALQLLAPDIQEKEGWLYVSRLRDAIQTLSAAGWRVE